MNIVSKAAHSLLDLTPYRLIHRRRLDELRKTEGYRPSSNALAEHLRQLFARGRIECVFDVGANDGTYSRFLRTEAGYQGRIVSFEPLSEKAAQLRKLAAVDPLWTIIPCALGAAPGRATINIMKGDAFSSFRQPSGEHTQKYDEANVIVATEEVAVRTVAEVHAELDVGRFYLKMDTQGFDLEVFQGALPVLPHVAALQSELSFVPIYANAPSSEDALRIFHGQGYCESLLAPVGFDESLRIIEADCVMVHPERMR